MGDNEKSSGKTIFLAYSRPLLNSIIGFVSQGGSHPNVSHHSIFYFPSHLVPSNNTQWYSPRPCLRSTGHLLRFKGWEQMPRMEPLGVRSIPDLQNHWYFNFFSKLEASFISIKMISRQLGFRKVIDANELVLSQLKKYKILHYIWVERNEKHILQSVKNRLVLATACLLQLGNRCSAASSGQRALRE